MKKGWSTGKIIGLVVGIIIALIVLWISFMVSLFQLADFLDQLDQIEGSDDRDYYEWSYDSDDYDDYNDYDHYDDDDFRNDRDSAGRNSDRADRYEDDSDDFYGSDEEEYYEFEDYIRNDLSYQVSFETYQKSDFISGEGKGTATLIFDYPVISGDVPNIDGINQTIYGEIDALEEHVFSIVDYLTEEDVYEYSGYGYVTYMSEDVLSVIYVEYGYLNNSFLESYVISFNFDMQTGMKLSNTNLVNISDSFSVDFRERCEKQNGENYALSYMSDQEITAYLTEENYLIIFYTPMGMEIGFNYYDGWVTVTYKDYKKFVKQF